MYKGNYNFKSKYFTNKREIDHDSKTETEHDSKTHITWVIKQILLC